VAVQATAAQFDAAIKSLRLECTLLASRRDELHRRQSVLVKERGGEGVQASDKLKLNCGGSRIVCRREVLTTTRFTNAVCCATSRRKKAQGGSASTVCATRAEAQPTD
jgi:hypothetical protein